MSSNKKKIMSVFGTRPEVIKMAMVIKKLEASEFHESIVCLSGQHREMLDQALHVFGITPHHDLNVMSQGQDLFDVSTRILLKLKDVLNKEKPDMILTQGDTTTAFIAGLAAFYLKIPLAHIEAGLRTGDKYNPFPEEKNRHLLSTLADIHFAPSEGARRNLLQEGISPHHIVVTGNTGIDALLDIARLQLESGVGDKIRRDFAERLNIEIPTGETNSRKLILVTGHRRESFGVGLQNICSAIKEIADARRDVVFVYPVHLNPNVQSTVKAFLQDTPNILLTEPLQYENFVYLMSQSYLILTDSGGIQEEAPSLGKPVLVTRNKTERVEGVEAGSSKLVGTDKSRITKAILELLDDSSIYRRMSQTTNPYGDGKASLRIVNSIGAYFNNQERP